MKGTQHLPSRPRWRWALWFGGSDLLLLLGLYGLAGIKQSENVPLFGIVWRLSEYTTRFWGFIHSPTRLMVEPILFPVMTSHPVFPSVHLLFLYQALCIFQSVVAGFLVGIAIEKFQKELKNQ